MDAKHQYKVLVEDIRQRCEDIITRYPNQIACTKGCPGNCCRIHLSVFAVEAFHLAAALKSQPTTIRHPIQKRASVASPSSPCPVLAAGSCQLYRDRLILCRTHGLPMRTQYRGTSAVGWCQKNFRQKPPTGDIVAINLDELNDRLVTINRQFIAESPPQRVIKERYLIAEALLLEI